MTLSHLTLDEPEIEKIRLPLHARTSQSSMVPLGPGAATLGLGVLSDAVTALLIRSGQGDTDAFAKLYDVTSRRIYGLVLRVVPSKEDAERFTQVAYVQLWTSARHYSPESGNALSWIIMQAHHSVTEHSRSHGVAFKGRQRGGRRVVQPSASLCHPTTASDVSALTRDKQETLTLVCLGGYNPRQVSELLRLPKGTVLAILRDGLLQIRNPLPAAF